MPRAARVPRARVAIAPSAASSRARARSAVPASIAGVLGVGGEQRGPPASPAKGSLRLLPALACASPSRAFRPCREGTHREKIRRKRCDRRAQRGGRSAASW